MQALLIHVDGVEVGWAKVAELRKAIEVFRKTGKKAYAYMDSGEAKDYLVASGCDFIALPESGMLVLVGMRAEVTFYKELLEKLGIRAEFIAMGVFKAFAEPYTRSKMSPEAKSQLKLVLDDFFALLVQTISRSRLKANKDLTPAKVDQDHRRGPVLRQTGQAARPDRPCQLSRGPRRAHQERRQERRPQDHPRLRHRRRPRKSTCPIRSRS